LVGLASVMLSAVGHAEPLRLEQRIAPACEAAARELAPRVELALAGSLPNALDASVAIDATGAGYRATIALRDAAAARGTTRIDAPTCEEAVDAAAVVLALAFAREPDGASTELMPPDPERKEAVPALPASSPSAATRLEPRPEPPVAKATTDPTGARVDRQAFLGARAPLESEAATRISLATGIDAGTLSGATMTLSGAVLRSFGVVELGAMARYGMPAADETIEAGFSLSERRDFGSLELRACRALGRAIQISTCAGTEIGVVRAARKREGNDGSELDEDSVLPRLSGTLAALAAHRGGFIEPELELAGAVVALGRDEGAPWVVVRVSAGAAVAF
jgi:hypothetical protein